MLITTFGLKSWPLFSVAHWTGADWKWQCCCWRMLTSIIIIIIYSNIPHFLVSEMFMKNVKWWKVRTFPVFTSLTFIWTGLHHPCLPGISPISPIVWRTSTSPVHVGVMVSGDGFRLTGWSDQGCECVSQELQLTASVLGFTVNLRKVPVPVPFGMCIRTQFSDWFSSKIPILNTEHSQPGAQFRGPFSFFKSFFSGNEQLKWTKAAVIHICA